MLTSDIPRFLRRDGFPALTKKNEDSLNNKARNYKEFYVIRYKPFGAGRKK